jgi:hypothetical protein
MAELPFDGPGRFWKGNLHTHSDASDGHNTPEEVCRLYREAGYHFLALTDHFLEGYGYPLTDTRPFRADGFTTLLGAELHSGSTELGDLWHILAVGLPENFRPGPPEESGPQLAGRALEAGAYVAAAHPQWYGLSAADILSLGDIHAIEVFNGVAVDANDRADSWQVTDLLLSRGHRYTACATDDFHGNPTSGKPAERDDLCRGWVQVWSETLDPEALLSALKAGAYYSSTGPEIFELRLDGETLQVRCSVADRVFVTGMGARSRKVMGPGLVEAELDLSGFGSPYARVTVRDRNGGRAWSNPIWIG